MQNKITKELVDKAYEPLSALLKGKYGISVIVSEMSDIINAVEKVNENTNELFREICDVAGCDNNSSCGGAYWKETGYWMLCHNHFTDGLNQRPQPEMKPEAIEREKSRDSEGVLPPEKEYPFE